jgi:ubiquinone/menaquinone biosynthesis C-methylase UbiE
MNRARERTPLQEDGYVLTRGEREYRRLVAQSQVWDRATRRALDQVSRRLDANALDVGCGTGDVMRLIAERISRSGSVTGLDIDARLETTLLPRQRRDGHPSYRFVAADVTQLDAVPGGPFDLVFARLLLFHMRDPVDVLKRLWSWVRPGGALLVMDYDITGARSCPQHPTIERALRLIGDAFRRAHRDIEIGTRLPELFAEAGIGAPDGCEVSSVIIPGTPSSSMLCDVVASLRPSIVNALLSDTSTLDRLERELSEDNFENHFLRWPDMVATWKRKFS